MPARVAAGRRLRRHRRHAAADRLGRARRLRPRRKKVGDVIHRPGREPLERLTALLEAGTVVPVIDGTYALADARAAFERYGSGEFLGKIVITHA